MIIHLPMIENIIVPGNITLAFSAIIPIVMFDVFESFIDISKFLPFHENGIGSNPDELKDYPL